MAYTALVTRLHNFRKDENSNTLYLADCYGEGVIVGGDYTLDELVLYMPADGKVERWFGDHFKLFRKNLDGTPQGGYLADNGHIKALKLRGNLSYGIVLSVAKITEAFGDQHWLEDMEVTQINGKDFVTKYIPVVVNDPSTLRTSLKGKKANFLIYPEFERHVETAQLAYHLDDFHAGDRIGISVKIHGSSQRSMKTYAEIQNHGVIGAVRNFFHLGNKVKKGQYVLGTRRTIVYENSKGFYGSDDFRWQHHEKIKPFLESGMEVFYEVAGWYGPNFSNTIMPIADNRKLNDPDFIKQFGDRTVFSYGCEPGQSEMFVYRITSDNGLYEYSTNEIIEWCEKAGVKHVPYLEEFDFTSKEDLLERVNHYLDNLVDPIGGHLTEGVVIRVLNRRKFTAYKIKNFPFKVLSGIVAEGAAPQGLSEDILSEF